MIRRWLNRNSCKCTTPGTCPQVLCWRHSFLWFLGERGIIVTLFDGGYWHESRIEWRPWRWHRSWTSMYAAGAKR